MIDFLQAVTKILHAFQDEAENRDGAIGGDLNMPCNRGRASPNGNTKLKLFSDSGGYCQNPACNMALFPEDSDRHSHFAEMAHIFAATDGGPRANIEMSGSDKANYKNLLLLCANCHTIIDNEPQTYTDELITEWKRNHKLKLQSLFSIREVSSRAELRADIDPLLKENRAVHVEFSPEQDYQFNPEAPEARVWKSRVRSSIIPNSSRILMFLDRNNLYLTAPENLVLERFRIHVKGLIDHHINGSNDINILFPADMNTILCD